LWTALAVPAAPAMAAAHGMPETGAHGMPETATMAETCATIDASTEVMRETAAHAVGEAVAGIKAPAAIIRSVVPVVGLISVIIRLIGITRQGTAVARIVY
jgi:hypothetical protein